MCLAELPTVHNTHKHTYPHTAFTQAWSIVLASGTLSPLDTFAGELRLPFHVQLEAPHVVNMERQVGQTCGGRHGCVSKIMEPRNTANAADKALARPSLSCRCGPACCPAAPTAGS